MLIPDENKKMIALDRWQGWPSGESTRVSLYKDRKRKNDLKAVIQEAYESGKRPKFRNGKLYIDGIPYNS